MRNQRLIEALGCAQIAMQACEQGHNQHALSAIRSAGDAMALAPELAKDGSATMAVHREVMARLEDAATDLRLPLVDGGERLHPNARRESARDRLKTACNWIQQLIVMHAMPSELKCDACKRTIGKAEVLYCTRRGTFSCAQCLVPPGNCPGCGRPNNNGEPGFCMACLSDKPDLRENR